ncbi:hypothetical protein QWY75_11425 [Pontixanthobacter aestiaquae]|uniref:Lipoprotein n=1 Tax=Pontixanthobacter aestiaquae TaxID=1509367 RepID=A0A844Z4K4_9SPHN|nr:hypothetical protein [Pontixanthobacter aestiaquae]MDN3646812.1 hypothetical protein [Pontixanthobacter aestiaquae]MXO82206.1 hypothetical protein [Pontixanthobacter aestiaquae]
MKTKPKRNLVLATSLSLVLAGCDQTPPQKDAEPEWEELSDGSHLLLSSYDEVEMEDLERCYESIAGLECLRAVSMVGGQSISFQRQVKPSLNRVASGEDTVHSMSGYHCQLYVDGAAGDFIRESIWSKRGELKVNTVRFPRSFNEAPLSKEGVEGYFDANSIDPKRPWLNCYQVAHLVVDGSLASLTSSDLTLEAFTTD